MIKSIKFIEGFTIEDIYKDSDKEFHFTEGLNIWFGANGVGKSVALKFMKAYASIPKGGWTQVVDPKALAPDPFPHCYRAMTPEKDRVEMDWDGSPVFYNAGDISDNNAWFFQAAGENSDDGLSTESERFETMIDKPSSGQYRLKQINKILQIVENPHDYHDYKAILGDVTEQLNYLDGLPKDGKITLLLDEPERSLSLPKQKKLLEVLLEFSEKHQIIMACHSPFVLGLPRDKVNFLEIDKGYVDECDELFNFN